MAVFILVFLLGAPLSFAQERVPSQIKKVTLFTNQALVKREAKAKVHRGLNEIFLELHAFRVDRDSVSAKVFGEGEIFSVQFKEIYLKESPQENIRALEEKIEGLERAKRILLDEKNVSNEEEKFLTSIVDFSQTQVPQDIKTHFPEIEDWEKSLAFLRNHFQVIHEKRQSLDFKIKEIEKRIKKYRNSLATKSRRH